MDNKKGIKLVYAPGCFDNFEGTQEELDAIIAEIERGFENGTFIRESVELDVDDIEELTDEQIEDLAQALSLMANSDAPRNLH